MDLFAKLKDAAEPLQKIILENYDPLHVAMVSSDHIAILGTVAGVPAESEQDEIFSSRQGYCGADEYK